MRNVMKASLVGVLSAAVLGLGVAMTPNPAAAAVIPHGMGGAPHVGNFGHGPVGRGFAPGFVGGLAAGAIIGSAAAPYYDYGYGYDPCYQYRPVYDQWGRYLGRHLVDVCQ